jgi:uncharacterized membrane protein
MSSTAAIRTKDPVVARRFDSVDLLRGSIMVIMALDHAREFFGVPGLPENVATASFTLFFTRWITHFCAPLFLLLAGTGSYFSASRGKPTSAVSTFLLKRGLWLVFVEITIVDFGFTFQFPFAFAGVIWVIGWSMIALAALVWLPPKWVGAIGVAICVFHHLLDNFQPTHLKWFWIFLHKPGFFPIEGTQFFWISLYVLIPWVGVMAAGYGLGAILKRDAADRRRILLLTGALMIALFVILRWTGIYGQPPASAVMLSLTAGPFVKQGSALMTLASFLNVNKYPPSLCYLLMTIGPGLIMLALFERIDASKGFANFVVIFGRVPFFYYVLHLYLLHVMAYIVALAYHQPTHALMNGGIFTNRDPGYEHSLAFGYAMWLLCVVILYWPCRWFARVKERRHDWWLRYL